MRNLLTALLLAALLAVAALQAHADGPVLWKQHCPRFHEVVLIPETNPDGGVNVVCIRQADDAR